MYCWNSTSTMLKQYLEHSYCVLRRAISTSLHSLLFMVSVPALALAIRCQLWNKHIMFCSIAPNSSERRQQYLFNPVFTFITTDCSDDTFSLDWANYLRHSHHMGCKFKAQSLRFIDFRCLTALPCENRVYHWHHTTEDSTMNLLRSDGPNLSHKRRETLAAKPWI